MTMWLQGLLSELQVPAEQAAVLEDPPLERDRWVPIPAFQAPCTATATATHECVYDRNGTQCALLSCQCWLTGHVRMDA